MLPALAVIVVAVMAAPPSVDASPAVEALEDPTGVKGLRATFLVAAPPDLVLETLWDVKRFRQIFPDIEKLEVLAEGPGSVDARFHVDAVLAKVSYTLRRDVNRDKRRIQWHDIGGDLEQVRGSWEVTETETAGVSRVVYTSFVDVAAIVPSGLVRDTALKKVDEMAGRVRAACKRAVLAAR